jgi:actin-like ATPase involved in cell morphogenesis
MDCGTYNLVSVPLVERKDAGVAFALGESAVDMAYTMSDITLRRPMKDGCLNPQEKSAQQILSIMLHGLLDNVTKPNETLFYSKPANAINEETDADYHAKVLEAIFNAFEDEKGHKVNAMAINEALALIYSELAKKQWTGLAISFGAGQSNVCFSIFGSPVFAFSQVHCGDYIDRMAAKATGETEAFINKEKEKVDLSENSSSLVQRAIKAQYELLIQKTVAGIKKQLEENENKARTQGEIDIVVAGGTSSPNGFRELLEETIHKAKWPIKVGQIIRPKDPIYSVARGCLLAAEASDKG